VCNDMSVHMLCCVAVLCFLVVLLMRFFAALVIWFIFLLSPLGSLGFTPFFILITCIFSQVSCVAWWCNRSGT